MIPFRPLLPFLTLLAVLFALPVHAADAVDIKVEGLICEFCAETVEKLFHKRPEVADVTIDLPGQSIHIRYVEGQKLENETLQKMITDAGYEVVHILPR